MIMSNDIPEKTPLPSPKRGAIPTPKEEIEKAPKYKPQIEKEQDTSSQPPDRGNNQ
jgi:hypothetical protein